MSQRSSIKSSKSRKQSRPRSLRDPAWARGRSFAGTRSIPQTVSTAQTSQAAASNRKTVKLVYSDIIDLTAGLAGVGVTHQFRANSIFDPNYSIGGHQPMGHDEWENFYHHYRVKSSSIRVNFTPYNSTDSPSTVWVSLGSTALGAGLVASTAIEHGRCAYKVIGTGADTPANPLKNEFDAQAFFGPTHVSDKHIASFGGNPGEDVLYTIGVQPMSALATEFSQFALVTIEYICELTEPKQLQQS